MKRSIISNLKVSWGSGKFSLWKISLILSVLMIFSPWLRLVGYQFTLESQLTNPERSLYVYANHGFFTFVSTLSDGTTRKSSGLVGLTNNTLYFLTLKSDYLHMGDSLSPALKRDLINVNNHFFDARLKNRFNGEIQMSYDEEIAYEGVQTQIAIIKGTYPAIR
ncbi:hypothetical protein AB4407_06070 [Vibrio sp. 10N.261.46.E11]|uniref:hypothetical protein n=1 Tax=Vibrio sp. 10N.261.46.E11 TaxID=3229662 RepID=UPI00354DD1AA